MAMQPEGSRMPELSPSEDRAENSRELRLAVAELSDRMGALAEELEHQRGAREAAEERAAHAEAAIQHLRPRLNEKVGVGFFGGRNTRESNVYGRNCACGGGVTPSSCLHAYSHAIAH